MIRYSPWTSCDGAICMRNRKRKESVSFFLEVLTFLKHSCVPSNSAGAKVVTGFKLGGVVGALMQVNGSMVVLDRIAVGLNLTNN